MKKSIFDLTRKELLEVNREFERTKYYKKNNLTDVSVTIGGMILFSCIIAITLGVYLTIYSTMNYNGFLYIAILWGIFFLNICTILLYLSNSMRFKMLRNYYNEKNNE